MPHNNEAKHGFQTRFGQRTVNARIYIIVATIILVGLASSGVIFLQSSTDYRDFFSKDNPELQAFEFLENTYGKSDSVLIMIAPDDRDATSEQSLSAVVWLTERAWQLPHASRVDSIANFPHVTADGDEILVQDLVDVEKIHDAQERSKIREVALKDPRLAGYLLARDGAVSAVHITVKLPDENNAASIAEVSEMTYGLATEAKTRYPGIDFRPIGTVIINQEFTNATVDGAQTILPASFAVMLVMIAISTRSLWGIAAIGSVVLLSICASMGMAGWLGIPLSTSTSAAPIIVLTLAVAGCIHLLVTFRECIGAGSHRSVAVVQSIKVNLYPIFLASVTTAFGFFMMNFSEVPPYRHLGTLVTIGTGISFVLSVTFLPALLSLLPMRGLQTGESRFGMAAVAEFTIRYRKILLWLSVAVIVGLTASVPRNELNDILTHFFNKDVQVRQNADFLDENLSGNTVIEYSISAKAPRRIADPEYLRDLAAFAQWYRSQPEIRHVLALSDTFQQLNMSVHGDDPTAYRIPDTYELSSQLLLLYEFSLPFGVDLNNRIDISKSSTRMTVTARTLSSQELLQLDARAKSWLKSNASSFSQVQSSGPAVMFAHIGERNIRAMLIGTVIAFLGVSLILIIAFRSLRIGLMSLASNFVPGLLAFGIWGMLVGQVGLALSVVMAMTIGIVVDDTVHFLSKYLYARRELNKTSNDAVRYAFQTVGRALTTTTIILVAGFLTLGLADFFPTAQMGQLTAIVIAFALVFDFLFLPPLLMTVDRSLPLPRSTVQR